MLNSTDPIDQVNPNYTGMLGTGRLNIYQAIAQGIYPSLSYTSNSLQIQGDTNGELNPGETALMRVTLKNEAGWNNASGISAILRSPNGDLHITDSTAVFPNISAGGIGFNLTDRFEFTVDSASGIGTVPVELVVSANLDSAAAYYTTITFDLEVSINQAGWPQVLNTGIETSPVVIDLDQDGENEVVATALDGYLYAWQKDGTMRNGFPVNLNGTLTSPAVGDVNGDGKMEIAVGNRSNHFYLVGNNGNILVDKDIAAQIWGTPTLADLDNNNQMEIIFGDFLGKLYVLNSDGSNYNGYPVDFSTTHRILSSVAIGDLNDDNNPDIIFGSFNGDIYAVDALTATTLSGFPVSTTGRVETDPILVDLGENDNRGKEIIVSNIMGDFYIISAAGNIVHQKNVGAAIKSSAAIADLNSDGAFELVFGTDNHQLIAMDSAMVYLPGFPRSYGNRIQSAPVIADLNGSGTPEIIFTSTDGSLNIIKANGTDFPGFPVSLNGQLKSTATLFDLDQDNDIELVVGSTQELQIFDFTSAGSSTNYWFTQQGNYQRTGNFADILTGIKPMVHQAVISDYTLAQNYPNPFNPQTTIRFTLPENGQVTLAIFNTLGQKVKTLVSANLNAGAYRYTWTGMDDGNRPVASGIYFYHIQANNFVQTKKMMFLK